MRFLLLYFFLLLGLPAYSEQTSTTYEGSSGIGKGKHLVFLASDHEYRTEEASPALARILAKHHGFKCTVIFGVDDEGYIEAGSSKVSGLAALKNADLFFIFARFLNLPDEEMQHIEDYLERGGPVVGLRTSSHAFQIPADSKFAKYDFKSKVAGYEKGFGHQILGNTWIAHYGKNHVQGTRIQIMPEQKDHVILTGVEDNAFTYAGAYVGESHPGFTVLTESQPLVGLNPAAKEDPEKPASPSTWTRHYTTSDGKKHRVFHSTQGCSEDLLDDSYRRLIINGILWAAGLEDNITADLKIDFVGPYQPSVFSFMGNVQQVKPEDLSGWDSPISPNGEKHTPQPKEWNGKPMKRKLRKSGEHKPLSE